MGVALILTVAISAAPAQPAGERLFAERCALCHSPNAGAAQGPELGGVVGRKAGTTKFNYSKALRDSKLTWDRASLDTFLTAPAALVPGTTMPVVVPVESERRELIDFLATLHPGDGGRTALVTWNKPPAVDFHGDAPLAVHRIATDELPPPYATGSAENVAQVVSLPKGASPKAPPGFRVDLFAHGLREPRLIRTAPSGDLFVAETQAGRVRVLRAADGAKAVEQNEVFADGLDRPFGIAFYPPGPDPQWVYVAENNRVLRYPYRNGDLKKRGAAEIIVPKLVSSGGGHTTRDVAFSLDGTQLFVSVGSASNVAEGGVDERDRADVLVFDPKGGNRQLYASGIRNCVGLAVQAKTGDVWCATNERDGLGDDLVPDYVTRVKRGGFYGWPWYYLGTHPDPRHPGAHPELAAKVIVPDVLVQAHSAPLEMTFYEATAFPERYRHRAFVACHGSWNRAKRTGSKVISVSVKDGVPSGEYEDFLTGFVSADESVFGRPVGVAVAHDGALFVSEDANDTIWRVQAEHD